MKSETREVVQWGNSPHALVNGIVRQAFEYDFRMKSNEPRFVLPRHIAMYLTRSMFRTSLPEIGRYWNGLHHTTVLHGIRKIEKEDRPGSDMGKLLHALREKIRARIEAEPRLYAHRSLEALRYALGRLQREEIPTAPDTEMRP